MPEASVSSRFDVRGLCCLITGAGRGIGRVIALGFAEAGAQVVAGDLDGAGAESVAGEITGRGGKALGLGLDVTSQPSDAITPEEWNRVMAVNLTGVFLCAQAVARVMRRHGGGRIINVASIFGLVGPVLHSATPYATTKGGVISMTRALAVEWAQDGIRVTAIAPTYVRTDMTRARVDDPDHRALVLGRTPLQRVLEPEDLLGSLLFLASRASEYVTGHVLAIDAGWLAE